MSVHCICNLLNTSCVTLHSDIHLNLFNSYSFPQLKFDITLYFFQHQIRPLFQFCICLSILMIVYRHQSSLQINTEPFKAKCSITSFFETKNTVNIKFDYQRLVKNISARKLIIYTTECIGTPVSNLKITVSILFKHTIHGIVLPFNLHLAKACLQNMYMYINFLSLQYTLGYVNQSRLLFYISCDTSS